MKKILLFLWVSILFTACHQQTVKQAGTIEMDTIQGVPCCVYLPYAYNSNTTYPVLYLQHGMFGNEEDWIKQGNLVAIMDSLLKINAVKEMVVIMPDNCPHRPTYEEEKDNATTGEWENNFALFMAEAEHKYSISTDPSEHAIAGLSMGGYHTMRVSYVLDGQFAYVGMFSPATFIHQSPTTPKVFWIGIGKEDFLYDSLQEYRKWLDTNHIEYTYYESTGGHTWPNWQDYITRFLPKLFH